MANWVGRFSLAGRRAMVTGASKGIGAEIVRVFADAGADIAVVARDRDGLAAIAAEVTAAGRRCLVLEADLATREGPVEAARAALAAWGTIDILVNSAGIALIGDALTLSADDWDRTMAVNLRAPFLLAQALAPAMVAQRAGKIINISSQTGVIALDGHAAYASSKGGLNSLTISLMCEWAKHNIQVNAICPTIIMTPMGRQVWGDPAKGAPMLARTPLGRFGEPVEVADLALYLASPASDLVNGSVILIDGGFASV
jgi:NAD(P)-dependent dehydrogenase (short-subunit alcohol dehydrogenase family)